ncbi:hypothetical protein MTR_2g091200 [Medicago truncatula]|uniref:Uncharacterized protein n=1 Tax=Medicago truncatula TaxID=3880 RepID=A0A072VMA3_MEDTR|nr:hypothetical protein MTR_2g091200 [Medicago truncatula]
MYGRNKIQMVPHIDGVASKENHPQQPPTSSPKQRQPPPQQLNNLHQHYIATIASLRRQTSSPRNRQQHKYRSRGRGNPTTKHEQRRRFEVKTQPKS